MWAIITVFEQLALLLVSGWTHSHIRLQEAYQFRVRVYSESEHCHRSRSARAYEFLRTHALCVVVYYCTYYIHTDVMSCTLALPKHLVPHFRTLCSLLAWQLISRLWVRLVRMIYCILSRLHSVTSFSGEKEKAIKAATVLVLQLYNVLEHILSLCCTIVRAHSKNLHLNFPELWQLMNVYRGTIWEKAQRELGAHCERRSFLNQKEGERAAEGEGERVGERVRTSRRNRRTIAQPTGREAARRGERTAPSYRRCSSPYRPPRDRSPAPKSDPPEPHLHFRSELPVLHRGRVPAVGRRLSTRRA